MPFSVLLKNKKKKRNIRQTLFLEYISLLFPIIFYYITYNQISIKISRFFFAKFIFFLKYHSNTLFDELLDITVTDFFQKKNRFEFLYYLLSISYNVRIKLTFFISENQNVESIVSIFPSANWYERECWDMFGIFFFKHTDLRRLLTDYGFKGHPLRKDFPVVGYIEVRYDDFYKRIFYDKVSLSQEYRYFLFQNSWWKI